MSPILCLSRPCLRPRRTTRRACRLAWAPIRPSCTRASRTPTRKPTTAATSPRCAGTTPSATSSPRTRRQGPFGYGGPYGYQTDPDHGLMLLGHRYYEADTGRFLTRDPIKDGRNWYGYCAGSPNIFADPSGLRKLGDTGNDPLPRPIADEPSNWWRAIGDYFRNGYDWWSGTDVIGPGGEPVRIGGWPSVLIVDDYAISIGGTVHLNDYEDFHSGGREGYINSKYWWRHEVRHIQQEEQIFGGSTTGFVTASIIGYILAGSHGDAPLEIDADNHSGRHDPPRKVFGGGAWPYVMGGREETSLWR
ncbi:MAG TPA: RHS repeat-associated core domain-containing protein [Fimbriimonadaceae bacterium]|nr:RHS repeat-associated core domain-containing protein [Fimbriimonadaceae bacterium]HRJ96067.1 RHS repeat-associated core domain-containing protein [Fimbriimonadaceae bacterium]